MAGTQLFNSTEYTEEPLLFWIVVQACRDIIKYTVPAHGKFYITNEQFSHAYEWIMDGLPQQIGDREYTFREALEDLGVDPRNVEHIRHAIARSPGLLEEERKRLGRETYDKLEGSVYEPEPWWRCVENLILNKEPMY